MKQFMSIVMLVIPSFMMMAPLAGCGSGEEYAAEGEGAPMLDPAKMGEAGALPAGGLDGNEAAPGDTPSP
ncbi:MAG: hypothetical protein O3C40_23300 [Planctomycetota bacterium]|nr:hypothetical protein [Planctomycetota bacterium]